MYKNIPVLALAFLLTAFCTGQSTDLFRLEYTLLPEDRAGAEVSRYRALINLPFKLKRQQYMIVGGEYNFIQFESGGAYPFDDDELSKLHVVDLNLGYILRWNENWRFVGILTPRLASNFVDGIVGRDFLINATATMWKERMDIERPFRLVIGLTYNSTTGLPVPLPLINYYRRFHPKWSYTLGIPRANFKYHASDANTIQMALFLDGYFVNAQNDIILPGDDIGSSISLSALVGALGYQYNFSKMISLYGFAGYTIIQNGLLRDDKRNNVFTLNDGGSAYFKLGFKISIF